MISENLSELKDSFLQAYKQGDISRANLTTNDFDDLAEQYNSGEIKFNDYCIAFYKRVLSVKLPISPKDIVPAKLLM